MKSIARPAGLHTLALVLVLILAALLSGCQSRPTGLDPALLPKGVQLFAATFEMENGTERTFRLGEPVRIRDRDSQLRLAYPLRVETNGEWVTSYYLDEGLRNVRFDVPCRDRIKGECQYATATWTLRGTPAPLGIGLSNFLTGDSLQYVIWNVDRALDAHAQRSGIGYWINVIESDEILRGFDSRLDPAGRYEYEKGEHVPTRVHDGAGHWIATRTEYTPLGAPKQRADAWPTPTGPNPAGSGNAFMFPGDQGDDFRTGVSYADAVQRFLANESTAKARAENGCITSFHLQVPADPPGPVAAVGSRRVGYTLGLMDPQSTIEFWAFTRESNLFGETYAGRKRLDYEANQTCTELQTTPRPVVTASAAIEQARRLPVSAHREQAFGYYFGPWSLVELPASGGIHHHWLQWVPKFVDLNAAAVSFQPYTVHLDAHSGWLESFDAHPQDIIALDQER